MISIIIPIYNCEKYIRTGIKSLINQTIFEKMELIFVNDGSTDNSENIIKEYVDSYSNMILISQENRGVSSARNTGISISNGDYVSFFDIDDLADPYLYETLYKLITVNNADMSIVGFTKLFDDNSIKKYKRSSKLFWDNNLEALKSFFSENLIGPNVFDKMFTRNIVSKIEFPEGFAVGEDMFYVYKALCKSNKIVVDTTNILYTYCIHSNSAMKQSFSDKYFDAVYLSKKILEESSCFDDLKNFAEANYIHEVCKMLGLMYQSKSNISYNVEENNYRIILKRYSLFKEIKYMDLKHVIALELMKFSPSFYSYIYSKMKVG